MDAHRGDLHQPPGAQRVRGEQFAPQRDAEPLLGGLQHHARVIERSHRRNGRAQPGGVEPVLPDLAFAQQGLPREGFRRIVGKRGRRFRRRQDDQRQRHVEQGFRFHARPGAASETQRRMESIAQQIRDLLGRVDLQRQAGIAGPPPGHPRQQPALRERRQHRHSQALFAAGGGGRCRKHPFIQLSQSALNSAQQGGPGRVQDDAPPAAFEQRKAQLFFQPLDLLADRAVGQVQPFRCRAQILQFGHRAESGEGVQRQTHGAIRG
jgi:hypothetical protein